MRLTLPEEFLLLVLDDDKGTIVTDTWSTAIAAAILAELRIQGRLSFEGVGHRRTTLVSDPTPVGDRLLDDCLAKIVANRKRRHPRHWIAAFSNNEIRDLLATRLIDRGVLSRQRAKFLLLFKHTVYPELDPGPERELKARLLAALVDGKPNLDSRTAVTLAIADATELLEAAVGGMGLEPYRERLDGLVASFPSAQAAHESIAALRVALMVAVIT